MRPFVRFWFFFGIIGLFPPLSLIAQFTQPTDEELRMTADPKAPGEAAIYLYREEITDNQNGIFTLYNRIKILTEKGKSLATVKIPYDPNQEVANDIQGRTIHADGAIVPMKAKPEDLMDVKTTDVQVNSVTFTLPSVEVGSIIEYRVRIRERSNRVTEPLWEVQTDHFARKEHFEFRPVVLGYVKDRFGEEMPYLLWSYHLGPDAKVNVSKATNTFKLDVADVPAAPDEDWMPPMNTSIWRVQFYYTSDQDSNAYWPKAEKRWNSEVSGFIKPTSALKKIAAELVAPGDSDTEKARKIYAAVQKLDNTRFSRTKTKAERKEEKITEIRKAEDVWNQKSGTDDDMALLYVALCRAAGLKAYAARVVDRSRANFDMDYLSTQQLDDNIAIVSLNGKEIFLDPGQKMCPFGAMSWKHNLASGLRMTDRGADTVETPEAVQGSAKVQRNADLTVDPSGGLAGTVRVTMTGPEALYWRQSALQNDEDELKKLLNEEMGDLLPEGVSAEFDRIPGLDGYESDLIATAKISGSAGWAQGKRLILPGLLFESRAKHPFLSTAKRETSVDVHYPSEAVDEVTYHLPPGYSMEGAGPSSNVSWPDNATLQIHSQASSDSVTITRKLAYNYTLVGPIFYPALQYFYQKVAREDQQQIVLTRTNTVQGRGGPH